MRVLVLACRRLVRSLVAVLLLALPLANASAADADDVLVAMEHWAATYASSGPTGAEMLPLYTPDAVFWGTGGRTLFVGAPAFQPYFAMQFSNFRDRSVTFHDPKIRVYGDGAFATSTGTYEFNVTAQNGQHLNVTHRYSFALVKVDGLWLIAQQHSSAMPQ